MDGIWSSGYSPFIRERDRVNCQRRNKVKTSSGFLGRVWVRGSPSITGIDNNGWLLRVSSLRRSDRRPT